MKLRMVKYSVSWLALILLITAATMGLIVSFKQLEPGGYDIVFLCLAWIVVVASGIWLFIYATREILHKEIEKQEAINAEASPERKREKKRSILEGDSLDIDSVARKIIRRLAPDQPPAVWGNDLLSLLSSELEIMSGIFYYRSRKNIFESAATYAFSHAHEHYSFKEGEGLTGQAAQNQQQIIYTTIPDEYSEVFSGLGSIRPTYIAMIPVVVKNKCLAVIECAGFKYKRTELEQLFQIISRELAAKIDGADKKEKE